MEEEQGVLSLDARRALMEVVINVLNMEEEKGVWSLGAVNVQDTRQIHA